MTQIGYAVVSEKKFFLIEKKDGSMYIDYHRGGVTIFKEEEAAFKVMERFRLKEKMEKNELKIVPIFVGLN